MRKFLLAFCLAPLAACVAPDPAYQQAMANIPPNARAICTYHAQLASAAEQQDPLGMMAVARYNRTERQCLEMMAQQYPQQQPTMTEEQLKTIVRAQIAKYGMEPVKACYVAARDHVPGDDMVKLRYATSCVDRLPPA